MEAQVPAATADIPWLLCARSQAGLVELIGRHGRIAGGAASAWRFWPICMGPDGPASLKATTGAVAFRLAGPPGPLMVGRSTSRCRKNERAALHQVVAISVPILRH